MSRRRYRKNPSALVTTLMIGGGGIAAFLLYSKLFAKKASAATSVHPITGKVTVTPITAGAEPTKPAAPGGGLLDMAKSLVSGVTSVFTGVTSAATAMSDVEKFKAYQNQLNALGAALKIDGIVGQKTLDANNKFMPVKYTSIALLKSAILGGVAGVAGWGLSNYVLEA